MNWILLFSTWFEYFLFMAVASSVAIDSTTVSLSYTVNQMNVLRKYLKLNNN